MIIQPVTLEVRNCESTAQARRTNVLKLAVKDVDDRL